MHFIKYIFVFVIFFVSTTGWSQQYNFRHFTTKDGLANALVNHIFCDSKGFMWMSTQGGLSKFDGSTFINFTSREGLPSSDILCTAEDKNKNLWVATNGSGVSRFNGSKFTTYDAKHGFIDGSVYTIFNDSKNRLWFATTQGIYSFENNKFVKHTNGLPETEYYCVCEDLHGNLWFGSKGFGPIRFDGKKFWQVPATSPISGKIIFSILCDKKGKLWCGSPGGGMYVQGSNDFYHFEDGVIDREFIAAIKEDEHHNIWIATDKQLVKINGSKKQYFNLDNGLTSSAIYSLGFDKDGRLWVGTINGLNVFINEAFTGYNDKNGLTNNNVTVFCSGPHNDLLIGTAGSGLFVFDGEKIKPIDIPEISNTNVLSLFKAANGEIYVGLNNEQQGIFVIEKKENKYVVKKEIKKLGGKDFNTVSGFAQRPNGDILIGSFGNGVWILDKNGHEKYLGSYEKTFKDNDVITLFLDSKQNLWVSINRGGVVKYDFKTIKRYTVKNGLGDNTVWSICEDNDGNMIFGNNENGISIFDGKKFRTFNKENHLSSNNVQAVSADKHGNIWAGTNNGLNKIKIDKDLNLVSIKLYNESNGLIGTEINQNGIYADNKNTLWIGSNLGLTRYLPFFDYRNTNPPNVVLNNIKLNFSQPKWKNLGVAVDEKTKLPVNPVLSYQDNHLTFYFQALTLDQVEFSYMLEGLDEKWTPMSSKNEADYTNIPPGEYIFKVKAINSDGVSSKIDLNYKFTINPPFWQTWWFRITAGIILIALVVLIIKRRTAQLAKEKKILEDKVAERTSELSVANSQLSVALHDIKDSIFYAQKIQQSILPNDAEFSTVMNDSFVLFKPKDIVSGDFYWLTEKNGKTVYATCDCTGHGVPGGFMTMLGTSFLNELVNEDKASEPGKILDQMRERIIEALKQTGATGENKDGMDMVMCIIDKKTNNLQYAAANNGFYLVRNNELQEMKADKQPIGYFVNQQPFNTRSVQLQKGDVIYTFTDGYADQFGGPAGKKFKYKQLEQLLLKIHNEPMNVQKRKLDEAIENWMKDFEQIDDILLIGYRVG